MQRPPRTGKRNPQRMQRNPFQPNQRTQPPAFPGAAHPEPRTEQERQQRERAERRERALLWTDDRPFSIYKS